LSFVKMCDRCGGPNADRFGGPREFGQWLDLCETCAIGARKLILNYLKEGVIPNVGVKIVDARG
jgi:hypothetical protein